VRACVYELCVCVFVRVRMCVNQSVTTG